jgi:hypothetical protein
MKGMHKAPHFRTSKRGRKFRAGRGTLKRKIRRNYGMAWDIPGAEAEGKIIEYMSPEDYLKQTGLPFGTYGQRSESLGRYFDTEAERSLPIQELSKRIKDPKTKVRIPYVGDPKSGNAEHEGRHRAYAAELAGEEKIPVAVSVPIRKREDVAEKFIQQVFPRSHASYKDEWRERFAKGHPEFYMDTDIRNKYNDLLKEEGLR